MNTLEALRTRRSIRIYTDQPVAPETIREILEAAMMAPSAGNQQPWHFIVIEDRDLLNRIPEVHPYARMAASAALAILVCGDTRDLKHPHFWVQDCSAAVQNILLAAHERGLGSVWCGVYPREDRVKPLVDMFSLPDGVQPVALIPIGYPAERPIPENRIQWDRVHKNKW